MMTPRRKLLGLLPFLAAVLLSGSDRECLVLLVAGMVFWIPYWLSWWLSDGFSIFNTPHSDIDDDPTATGYRWGTQGYGLYKGGHRIFF